MSVYNFEGYLASPRKALGAELIGFNRRTGQPVQAAAGVGSYQDLSTDFYKTFQHDNWQHPGSSEWSAANVPGWGENPNLQMFSRRAMGAAEGGSSVRTLVVLAVLGGALLMLASGFEKA